MNSPPSLLNDQFECDFSAPSVKYCADCASCYPLIPPPMSWITEPRPA